MAENVLYLMTSINLQIQEVQGIPSRKNTKKSLSRHIIVKLLKDKQK